MHRRFHSFALRLPHDHFNRSMHRRRWSKAPYQIQCQTADFATALARLHRFYRAQGMKPMADSATDPHFFEKLSDGNAQAWRTLIDNWSPRLYNFLIYTTHSEAGAQQLLQHTFATVANMLTGETLRLHTQAELTILIVSTLNRMVEEYRSEEAIPPWDDSALQQRFDQVHCDFLSALQQLVPAVRHLLLLRYLVGVSTEELSAITGYSVANIQLIVRMALLHFTYSAK